MYKNKIILFFIIFVGLVFSQPNEKNGKKPKKNKPVYEKF